MKTPSLIVVVCNLFFAASSAFAEGNSIRGLVVDAGGKPIAGAEVRADRTDRKGKSEVATTNEKGQYAINHLDTGKYKVVALVQRTPKSTAIINTSAAGWVKVDFAIRDVFQGRVRRDQSATERVQGQDLHRTIQDWRAGH